MNDNDVKGEGNQQDYGMRIYDPRVGRFLSVDPITSSYPELTPYQFASNRPIDGIDLDGLEYFDSKKFGRKSLYGLVTFKQPDAKHAWSDIIIRDQEVHKTVMGHPENRKDKIPARLDDPDGPEIASIKTRSSSNKAQAREKAETKVAKLKASGDVAGGMVDLVKWGMNVYHNTKFRKEMEYASASINAVASSELLVSRSLSNNSFPGALNDNSFLGDVSNFLIDGSLPASLGRGSDYIDLVQTWGELIWNNRENIINGAFNFSPLTKTAVSLTINQSDGISHKIYVTSGNNSPDVNRAHEKLKKFGDKIPKVVPSVNSND